MKHRLSFKTKLNTEPKRIWNWHAAPGAFERLCPYWESVVVRKRIANPSNPSDIAEGATVELDLYPLAPLSFPKLQWTIRHHGYIEGSKFEDQQIKGPFQYWNHQHIIHSDGSLEDTIDYELPFSPISDIVAKAFTEAKLKRLFKYRHSITANDLLTQSKYKGNPMKILVTGATGLVGKQLSAYLSTAGHSVYKLVRKKNLSAQEIYWNPDAGEIDTTALDSAGLDAVIHLAGENIAAKRWTTKQKSIISASRVNGTTLLAKALASLKVKPKALVSASAIGFYGDRAGELLNENSSAGGGNTACKFLAETCQAWEAATKAASDAGIRVVHARFGVILDPRGGALSKLLLPFQIGAGGIIGNGRQYMSWIAIDDVLGALYHCVITDNLCGAVNIVAPNSLTNSEFTRVLGRVLWRPTIAPLPAFVARLILGEMADGLLLSSARVEPKALVSSNYKFQYTELEPALRHLLGC